MAVRRSGDFFRRVLLDVPAPMYADREPYALVVLLHGGGNLDERPGNVFKFREELRMHRISRLFGVNPTTQTMANFFVTLWPEALTTRELPVPLGEDGCWNTGLHGDDAFVLDPDDLGFVFESVAWAVDVTRARRKMLLDPVSDCVSAVHLYGYGTGGTLAWQLLADPRRETAVPGLALFEHAVIQGATARGVRLQPSGAPSRVVAPKPSAVAHLTTKVLVLAAQGDARVPVGTADPLEPNAWVQADLDDLATYGWGYQRDAAGVPIPGEFWAAPQVASQLGGAADWASEKNGVVTALPVPLAVPPDVDGTLPEVTAWGFSPASVVALVDETAPGHALPAWGALATEEVGLPWNVWRFFKNPSNFGL